MKLSSTRPRLFTTATFAGSYLPSAAACMAASMMTAAPSLACMAATAARKSSLSSGFFDSSAAVGHTVAQVPQPMQRSGATAKSLPSTRMAPVGHASAQRRQVALRLRTTTQRLGCTASD